MEHMKTNFEELTRLINKSSLKDAEKDELVVTFATAPDEELAPVVALIVEDPEWILKLHTNLVLKKEALQTGNSALWDNILRAEEKIITDG